MAQVSQNNFLGKIDKELENISIINILLSHKKYMEKKVCIN